MELGRLRAGSSALSSRPQAESRDAATTDSWTSFLQCYDSLLARELAQEQPQFVRALRQLERDSRLQQERQSAQVLATLRLKDAKISELQRLVSEQSEQLDVVLDELERRETKEDKQVQVDVCRDTEDAAVQTETLERTLVDVETQTEQEEGERGVLLLLQKLERELSAVEQRNVALETQLQLQQRATTSETTERRTEDDERMEACLESLQRGVEAMNLSCGCVENPLAFCVGVPREDNDGKGSFGAMATCVNLEHRLEAQAVRLEHLHECLHVWRDAAVQLMKRQNGCDEVPRSVVPSIPQAVHVAARCDEGEEGAINCSVALRGALKQIRERYNQRSERGYDDEQRVVRDLAQLLAKGKSGVKAAAKMVQKWAGWEASHLEEVRALRQGAAEERAVGVSRRIVLLKRIDELEQRELDLQAELNALRKSMKGHDTRGFISSLPPESCGAELSGADTCDRPIKYPQLMLRLATAEQNLLVKDEQLKAANGTIRALSSCSPTPSSVNHSVAFYSDNDADSLAVEVQRSLQQKLEFFRKREKDLVNLGQYFRMEKVCLQLKSRLDAEQKHAAMLQAALQVCERERDELLMQVEKLESEAMLARITCEAAASRPSPVDRSFSVDTDANDTQSYVFFMLRRLRLVEDDNKNLRDRLRQSQQQVALMLRQQLPDDGSEETVKVWRPESTVFDMIAGHHRKCVGDFKVFHERQNSTQLSRNIQDAAQREEEVVDGSLGEWGVLLSHYEDLWIAFYSLYSTYEQDSQLEKGASVITAQCSSVLSGFGGQNDVLQRPAGGMHQRRREILEFELSRRDEKILLLQERLMVQEGRLCGFSNDSMGENCDAEPNQQLESERRSIKFEESDFSSKHLADVMRTDTRNSGTNVLSKTERPFLAAMKPQEPPLQFSRMSSNGSGNEIALANLQPPETEKSSNAMESQKHIDFTAKELQKCLTKCAELTSQNTKLARRLREEKEANKQYFTATQELQKQLSARTDANLELNHTLKQYQIQTADLLNPSIAGGNMEISLQSSARNVTAVSGIGEKDTNVPNRSSEHEYEDLREQLASREQENLALVQSLCTIKEKCAQMEAVHEKELRVKAAEHAEAMENYMRTVNETLSRIESDKHRLEDENVKLRAKVQQLEAETTRRELEQTQRSSKGTNTDGNTLESAASSREKESLKARVVDLELQLARERKLTEMVEQKQQLENQHEEQQESAAKLEAAKVKQEYEMRCETLKDLRNKLQHEFAEYQVVERASQQESDRRIDFLSTCIEEFVRLADTTAPTIGKNVSTDELYDLVMDLARAPPQVASKNIASSSQLKRQPKRNVPPSQRQKPGNRGQESVTTSRDTSWSDMLIAEERNQDESEMSEAMLWKLRASKMEAYVRSAMLQNDTFEDTIRQLELGLSNVKEELTSRLARETQLVAKLGALKSELATTKEQAASLAEKYQLTNAELEKRQGEVTNRGDETLRARMAVQRKTELLTQQRAKVASLQQELEQAAKKIERLGAAEKQAALLQQKAKEHTQQLLHARQSYERCRDDNVQLSFHLEKLKERHVAVVTRLKAARAENAQLRTQCSDLKNNTNPATPQAGIGMGRKDTHRGNQDEVNAVSIASLTDEARALKRRVLQKQDVIVSYKSKVAEFEAQLERQRDTMVKLARTNRELQQGQRQRQQQEFEFTSALQAKLEGQLEVKQEQLDGLRASVYDSFEAFVFCQAPVPLRSPSSSSTATLDNPLGGDVPEGNDELFDIKRWTDFSVDDLEELRLARGAQQSRTKRERESQQRSNKINKRKAAAAALREVEGALETTPEDCRAQICELLQCLCA